MGDVGRAWRSHRAVGYAQLYRVTAPELARSAIERGATDVAKAIAEHARKGLALHEVATARAAELRCIGLVEDEVHLLDEAVILLERSPRPVEHAGAVADAGRAHARRGDRDMALRLLATALERYSEMGATADAARIEVELREAGGRRKRGPASAARPTSGWDALTPAELHVVRLVSEGLTNREIGDRLFVARSTIQTHLLHVFRKLGYTSRAQLAAEAARRQL